MGDIVKKPKGPDQSAQMDALRRQEQEAAQRANELANANEDEIERRRRRSGRRSLLFATAGGELGVTEKLGG